ncbi:MAG: ABC transporter substrate-binding protein [Desulfobacteraceae bacterium]|nr:ABC transporter substrate-binding protein [Desulfobacteraceae bacterium]
MEQEKESRKEVKKGMDRRDFLKAAGLAGVSAVAVGSIGKEIFKPKTVFAQVKGPIKVGVVLPLSGGLELFGQQGIQGMKMAVKEINESGGVLGRKLELVIEDNKTDPKTSVEKATKLIKKDKVIAVAGPITSGARDAMTPTMTKLKTPLLYATDYEGGVCNRYLFCYSALPEHTVYPFIPWLAENYGKTFYLFGADYVWPHKMNIAVKKAVAQVGGTILAEEYTPFGVKEFSSVIRKMADKEPKVLVFTLPGADAMTFVKQFHEFGMKKKIKIAFMGFNENYMPGFTTEQAEGIVTCPHFIQSLDFPVAREFVEKQRKEFGDKVIVSFYVDSHYGHINFLKQAIEKADSLDKEKVIDAMGDQAITAPSGNVILRASDHHVILNMMIAEVENRELVLRKYLGPIVPPSQCAGKKMVGA